MGSRFKASEEFLVKWNQRNCNNQILDAGAGERRIRKFFSNNIYTSQDFGEYEGGSASVPPDARGTWDKPWKSSECDIICDITDIPRPDHSFDLITLFEVIEHLGEPLKAIQELSRLLKIDGQLAITCPNLCAEHQTPYFFYSGFSRYFFENLIPNTTGLKLLQLEQEGDFIGAHFAELNQITNSSKSRAISFSLKAILFISQMLIRAILKAKRIESPISYSGWFALYQKTIA